MKLFITTVGLVLAALQELPPCEAIFLAPSTGKSTDIQTTGPVTEFARDDELAEEAKAEDEAEAEAEAELAEEAGEDKDKDEERHEDKDKDEERHGKGDSPKEEEEEPDEGQDEADTTDEAEDNKTEDKAKEKPRKNDNDVVYTTDSESNDTKPSKPLSAPYEWVYDDSDEVTRDVETRRGAEFYPEGTNAKLDVPANDLHKADAMFSEEPNVFSNCILIRDFAEPLRVGSAIQEMRSTLHPMHGQKHGSKGPHLDSARDGITAPFLRSDAASAWLGSASLVRRGVKDGDDAKVPKLPDSLLLPKGGVTDMDTNHSELQVNMYAFLRSVAGEVAVIPNGYIANWGSKRRVPIAGYLCTGPNGPVLHTLPTPCMPTSLGPDGEPYGPPPVEDPIKSDSIKGASPSPAAAVPAPIQPKQPKADDEVDAEAEAVAEAALAEAAANSGAAASLLEKNRQSRSTAAKSYPYHIWVGGAKLAFSNKPKADSFCKRLAKKIGEDLGDTEWDTDLLSAEAEKQEAKMDMSLATFVRKTRKASADWTLGKKSLLVVVMDWMIGDDSRAPYSKQSLTPEHYRKKIFPRVKQAFQEMSYGQFDVDVTVVPKVVRYTKRRSVYMTEGYPFPGLYNGARESMEANAEFSAQYSFDKFDLAYVIAPQQAPVGTKGVAWVGAKGAMCNGCEEISENFQTMVAVHELGHNLGLSHASSTSLEYGNVYDWMGNYPDVQGLSYGLGYKLMLKWLPATSIARVNDQGLAELNDEYIIKPFDEKAAPAQGDLVGLKVSIAENPRDLFVSYRDTVGLQAGVYLTWQDKDKPNSELIDATCGSPSQQDARLQEGWTYMDPSGKIVLYVASVDKHAARIRAFRAPDEKGVAAIRSRTTFSDGLWKCPKSCVDADLLVTLHNGCKGLAQDGYCKGGAITMGGRKFSIDSELCPVSCDNCDAVMSESSDEVGCEDKNIKIGDMSCAQAAAGGYCDYGTNLGHVGQDICPKSCGLCPPRPAADASTGSFRNPTPARTHGTDSGTQNSPAAEEKPPTELAPAEEDAEDEEEADEDDAENDKENEPASSDDKHCSDDLGWSDEDGDGCDVYADFIKDGKLTQEEACEYGEGDAKVHCRKTCDSCKVDSSTCQDKECVSSWKAQFGKCWVCSDWKAMCTTDESFKADCPLTCGTCKPSAIQEKKPLRMKVLDALKSFRRNTTTTTTLQLIDETIAPEDCDDDECVSPWLQSTGTCFKCQDFAQEFCGRDAEFVKSCPKSCRQCIPHEKQECSDDFPLRICKRYVAWGWCAHSHVIGHCKDSCGICSGAALPGGQVADAYGGAAAAEDKDSGVPRAGAFCSTVLAIVFALAMR